MNSSLFILWITLWSTWGGDLSQQAVAFQGYGACDDARVRMVAAATKGGAKVVLAECLPFDKAPIPPK